MRTRTAVSGPIAKGAVSHPSRSIDEPPWPLSRWSTSAPSTHTQARTMSSAVVSSRGMGPLSSYPSSMFPVATRAMRTVNWSTQPRASVHSSTPRSNTCQRYSMPSRVVVCASPVGRP